MEILKNVSPYSQALLNWKFKVVFILYAAGCTKTIMLNNTSWFQSAYSSFIKYGIRKKNLVFYFFFSLFFALPFFISTALFISLLFPSTYYNPWMRIIYISPFFPPSPRTRALDVDSGKEGLNSTPEHLNSSLLYVTAEGTHRIPGIALHYPFFSTFRAARCTRITGSEILLFHLFGLCLALHVVGTLVFFVQRNSNFCNLRTKIGPVIFFIFIFIGPSSILVTALCSVWTFRNKDEETYTGNCCTFCGKKRFVV